jgi:hypothetical protein
LQPQKPASAGSERRKERRYEVQLNGELRFDGEALPVRIADLSGSGALVFVENPPGAGSEAELWIENFGEVTVEIMHAGESFCGLAFVHPALCRDRLLEWLRHEAGSERAAAQA